MCFTKMNGPQIEINGVATLCFNEEGTWFQGSITTEDDSQFVIYGTKSPRRRMEQESQSSDHCGCSPIEEGPGVPVIFDIRVVDCEVGEEYSLKRVHGRNGELCTFTCSSINFTTEKVYRGQCLCGYGFPKNSYFFLENMTKTVVETSKIGKKCRQWWWNFFSDNGDGLTKRS